MVIDMPIKNQYPAEDVNLGVVEIGAKLYPLENFTILPFMPVKLNKDDVKTRINVKIADNQEFQNATEYQSTYVDKGVNAKVKHPITSTGQYFVELIAEDEQGMGAGKITFSFLAIRVLYFLDTPDVKTEAPKANNVTVISPTDSYTATTDPSPDPDELIERTVEIDEGDEETCQEVAETLIGRWKNEQKSVSGNIDLTVTLRFKEKINIIYPESNINEEMILQKKEHDVTGRITTITCGDIILSDDELLARILDDMGV